MAETKKKKPSFWGKVGNIAKGTGKHALKIITQTDAIGDGPGQVSKKTIQENKKKREEGKMPYQKAVKEREAKNEAKNNSKSKPKRKKRGLMLKHEKKEAERKRRAARAKAWRENRAKKKANKTKASKVTDDKFLRNIK